MRSTSRARAALREERYGEVEARGHGNMPAWAREDTAEFWRASDEFERANGNTYREYELALPRELARAAQIALVQRFVEQELGTTPAVSVGDSYCTASDGSEQPHVHLMFSDRQQDGIERGPEQFFKRYNAKNPERGGARKFSYGANKAEAAQTYEGIRERWAKVQNLALEHAGSQARVDHRSLAEQGIHREPEVHRGPAVSGIEARGEVSQVGERQREQMAAREERREAVLEEARELERAPRSPSGWPRASGGSLRRWRRRSPGRIERSSSVGRGRSARAARAHEGGGGAAGRAAGGGARGGGAPAAPALHAPGGPGAGLPGSLGEGVRAGQGMGARAVPAGLTREEIQAGKAEFRAEYERHRAEEAARAQALDQGRERYAQQKAAELARQQELERAAKRKPRNKSGDRGLGRGRGLGDDD